MKILVVFQHYKPEPFALPDICEELSRLGHEVHVVTGLPNYPMGEFYPGYEDGKARDEIIEGVYVHRRPVIPRKTGVLFRFLNYYSFVISSCLYTLRLPKDFDAVLCYQTSPVMMARAGLLYAKRHKVRSVLYCLDLWPDSLLSGGIKKDSLIYRFYLGVSKRIYNSADVLMVSSHGFKEYFRTVLGIKKDLIYQPQYAEDVYLGEDNGIKKESDGFFDVMFAGNIGEAQSVDTIIEAAELLKNEKIRFHFVGEGSQYAKCKEMAKELPNVIFYGRHPAKEMPSFFAKADAMIVSLKNIDNLSKTLPGKVQAYMAAQKPLIGSGNGEIPWVINEAKCGVCSPAEDAKDLAECILQMCNNSDKIEEYGKNARDYYQKNFAKQIFIDRLVEILGSQEGDL